MKPEEMLDAYAAAVRAKDAEAFLALYDDDVRTFDLWGVWAYDGNDALRGMVTDWFGSLGDESAAVEFDDVRVQENDGLAAVSAFATFRGLDAAGQELRSMNNRLTWVLRRYGDDLWKIAHEHTSAPAGDDGRVSLNR